MNLNNFEEYVSSKILSRGYDYYKNNCVISLKKIDEHIYEAEVEGTQLYTVSVELDDEFNIVDSCCDCPFDMEEYCKHQAAVFLALRKTENITDMKLELKFGLPALKKRKVCNIQKILLDRTKDEIIDLLLGLTAEYPEIGQLVQFNFGNENDEDELYNARGIIKSFIENEYDTYGYLNNTFKAVKGADLVLNKARLAFQRNKYMHSLELIFCAVHEMMALIRDQDDSDGIIGGVISESFELTDEIIGDEKIASPDKEKIFDRLVRESLSARYDHWFELKLDLLEMCCKIADTEVLQNELDRYLLIILKHYKQDSYGGDYFAERINLLRYHMLEKLCDDRKTREFIEENLKFTAFRKIAIENAMRNENYEYAVKLALEGEKKDQGLPGLVFDWKQYRYQAYKSAGKLEEQRKTATDLILDGNIKYYIELKNTYDSIEWRRIYPEIIAVLEKRNKRNQVYVSILIKEGEKQKLLEYIKHTPSTVTMYYKHLIPEFEEEVYSLFQLYINQTAERSTNRKEYNAVCAIIQTLKKAGGIKQASEIKQQLFCKYAKRPAFRDELSRI